MCGIAGAVGLAPGARPDPERVAAMSCRIAHRGPDGEGVWTSPSGRACLAHRRLSVIDLACGQQPMVDEAAGVGLVFNGEIYNYRELRDALRRDGAEFRTASDTEVLLRAFQRDGARCVDRLRGMFAFAAWDERAGGW
jgi:asparagine synthase (glutamine-hydrolysing)